VVAILGPRQCGKTTFARTECDGFEYLDLERPSDERKIVDEPELFLQSRKRPLIIDEAQRLPSLFPLLRSLVDEKRKQKGQYVLLGSASFLLQKNLSESLSGRIGFLDLSPLMLSEIHGVTDVEVHWLKGGFPDALLEGSSEELNFDWFDAYTRTLIERDLPSLGIAISPREFGRLWAMCAHFHGNVLNMNKIAASLGVSPHTVRRYIDILEQTFALRRLAPYHTNLKKRLVKSPKLYFRDSGLFHYFTRITTTEELFSSPELGASFEGYVVNTIIDACKLETPRWEPFFIRTSDQHEIDLLLVNGKKLIPIEIKCTLAPKPASLRSMTSLMSVLSCEKGFVISLGSHDYPVSPTIRCLGLGDWIRAGTHPFWD
jgi:uncharacterized protein